MSAPESLPLSPTGLTSPRAAAVSVTGYVAWLALSAEPLYMLCVGQIPIGSKSVIGLIGLLLVPVLFALANRAPAKTTSMGRWISQRLALMSEAVFGAGVALRGDPGAVARLGCRVIQPFAALVALWGLQAPILAALLIISAAQLAAAFRLSSAVMVLVPVNVILFLELQQSFDVFDLAVSMIGNVSFQAFTVFMVAATRRATLARDELMRINAELMATRTLLREGARDEERLRISRELHDLVGHKLTALKLQLRVRARQAPRAEAQVSSAALWDIDDTCIKLADELLNDVRGVVTTLRQGDGIDLHQALAALVPSVPNPVIELDLAADATVPGMEQAHALLRCAQEGITNALRHSGCSRLWVRLARSGPGVALTIEDNGQGRIAPRFGNGLTGMQERLGALGGSLDVVVKPEHGYQLTAWLPHADARAA